MTKEFLLNQLPPYIGHSIVITDEQTVNDIIFEVLDAHKVFASHYNNIALFFDKGTIDETCNAIADFCKRELHYKEETEHDQTTMLPAGILTRGGNKQIGIDCKHFSLFAAGVLDALNRAGANIPWCYRFASYKLTNKAPHHVFVVVNPGAEEIWIDPTPMSEQLEPYWYIDKKVKADNMALKRIIAGVDEQYVDFEDLRIGAIAPVNVQKDGNNINYAGDNRYYGVFFPYLGLDWYADLNGADAINWTLDRVTAQLNDEIARGPHPGHTVTRDFVKWIYTENVRSWNFYYPNGVQPGFSADHLLPDSWPRPYITEDGRLNLDKDVQLDDYRNAEIHLLTAWVQDMINQYDDTKYPVKPRHLKEFSQGKEGDFNTRNLFTEARGDSFLKEVGEALGDVVEFVKEGVLKIVGSIPRNAFLGLVGLNAFNFARNLQDRIDGGEWEKIKKKWEGLGGNPSKLYNTIQDGKDKNAILGSADIENTIGEPMSVSAFLAAAAPIIALLLPYLNDKDGKVQQALSATKNYLAKKYPKVDFTPLGFLDKTTNRVIDIQIDDKDNELLGGGNDDLPGWRSTITNNPLPWAAGAAIGSYFLLNKGKQKKNIITPLAIGAGVYFLIKQLK